VTQQNSPALVINFIIQEVIMQHVLTAVQEALIVAI